MDIQIAKKQLAEFLKDKELTFCIKSFDNGEWLAQCNEISAIATCGNDYDISKVDFMIKDAILTAAGIQVGEKDVSEIIKFAGFRPVNPGRVSQFFKGSDFKTNAEADYVLQS